MRGGAREPGTRDGGESGEGCRKNFLGEGNDAFTCRVCGLNVLPLTNGSFRSHCPECLWSLHVDVIPGDRAAACSGLMEPVGLEGSVAAGWSVVHACTRCGAVRRNKTAEDDPRQPDSWERMTEVSRAPRRARGHGP